MGAITMGYEFRDTPASARPYNGVTYRRSLFRFYMTREVYLDNLSFLFERQPFWFHENG